MKERGAITLDVVDTVLSTRAHRAEEEAEGDPADAVVWDELAGRTREESTLNVTFVLFLCLACLIAAVGVVTDSPVTVVGAMVVGPEFGPLAALAVALVRRRCTWPAVPRWRCWSASRSRCWSLRSVCWPARPSAGSTLTSTRNLDEVDFIFQVGPMSFVVALFAGAAGMLSLVSAKSAALVGVFISVTTVPAAGFAVVAATVGDWDVAAKSAAAARGQPRSASCWPGVVWCCGCEGMADRRQLAPDRPERAMRGASRCDGINAMGIKVALEHRTSYTFDRLVEVYPHVVRLRPAPHSRTPIEAYSLQVEPADHFVNWQQDAFGNFLARLVFPNRTRSLTITVGLIADLKVINPFDFFIED